MSVTLEDLDRLYGEESPASLLDSLIEAEGGAAAVVEANITGRTGRMLDFSRLATATAPEQLWFRPGWLHAGTTLLPGKGGEGKSALSQHEATCGTFGRAYFAPECAPYRSLIWNAGR